MKPFSGPVSPRNIYEACLPFKLQYPYRLIKNEKIESSLELFPEDQRNNYVDEAQEIEIGTTYKLRPVIVISESEDDTYLVIAITKIKEKTDKKYGEYLLAVCDNKIKERHFLPQKKYEGTLKFNSLALVDAIYKVTKSNIYYRRGLIKQDDYDFVSAKLKKVLSG